MAPKCDYIPPLQAGAQRQQQYAHRPSFQAAGTGAGGTAHQHQQDTHDQRHIGERSLADGVKACRPQRSRLEQALSSPFHTGIGPKVCGLSHSLKKKNSVPSSSSAAVMNNTILLYRLSPLRPRLLLISSHTKKPKPPQAMRAVTVRITTGCRHRWTGSRSYQSQKYQTRRYRTPTPQ